MAKGTYRSKLGKGYLMVQCWQGLTKGPKLAKRSKVGKWYLKLYFSRYRTDSDVLLIFYILSGLMKKLRAQFLGEIVNRMSSISLKPNMLYYCHRRHLDTTIPSFNMPYHNQIISRFLLVNLLTQNSHIYGFRQNIFFVLPRKLD